MRKPTKEKNIKILHTNNYPYINKNRSSKKYSYILGLGGNIGNTKRVFDRLFFSLRGHSCIFVKQTSFLYINPPFGYTRQKEFTNTTILIKTNKPAKVLLKHTQYLEKRHKRKKRFTNSPRSLDIDIIVQKQGKKMIITNRKNLTIPHKSWRQRPSVVVPLRYMMARR